MSGTSHLQPKPERTTIDALRETVARLEGKSRLPGTHAASSLHARLHPDADGGAPSPTFGPTFGIHAIDRHLPARCLAPGLHEIAGLGFDLEHATTPALLAAHLFARHAVSSPILWVVERSDLFTPGLVSCGLDTARLIVAEAGRDALAVIEEGARGAGLAGVVGELSGRLDLTASRRIQLAAEAAGLPVLALRRRRFAKARGDGPSELDAPNAAATRWRIACLPSQPADPIEAGPFSLGVEGALWRLDLIRARGASPAAWTVEAFDASGRLALFSPSRDRPAAQAGRAGPDRVDPGRTPRHLVA